MRFLCLHGLGTSSSIFEAQTARIREQFGPTYEFVFLDGEVECDAAPGVSAIFPGPYFGWYPAMPSEPELTAARELVLEVLREEGPFDGLMGFSQGAALAASLILQHADRAYPLVDCAVFICGTLPWMLKSEILSWNEKLPANLQTTLVVDLDGEKHHPLDQNKEMAKSKLRITHQDPSRTLQNQACLLHPANSTLHFPIPTAYIYGGRKDEYFELSKALIKLGSEAHGVRVFDHEAGHVIPRGEFYIDKMVDTISWVAEKVLWRG